MNGLSIPPCTSNGTTGTNGTCMDRMDHFFLAFSSTAVLFVLVAVITGIVFVSLVTFHVHKRKMKKRKIQKAQEEYERDNCSPRTAKGKAPLQQCIVVRAGHGGAGDRTPVEAAHWRDGVQEPVAVPDTDQDSSAKPIPENCCKTTSRHRDHETKAPAGCRGNVPTAELQIPSKMGGMMVSLLPRSELDHVAVTGSGV
ncbi:uncharacterized protein C11orf87 homolog [Arapaima gigas]